MPREGVCNICKCYTQVELHHILFKSKSKSMKDCKLNHIYLCANHHRGDTSPHGKHNKKVNLQLRLILQNKLEILLDKQYFNKKQIQTLLEISEKATDMLCKTIRQNKGVFYREDIIRGCMGGMLIEQEENNDNT